jgi:hypothetical protein
MKRLLILPLATAMLSGCTHPLRVNNLNNYQNPSVIALQERLRLGIRPTAPDLQGHRLIHQVSRDLLKYNAESSTAVDEDNTYIDVIADISIVPEYKGSGWNFWVDFPGFLIWAPAWHGYNYHAGYDIDVRLNDAKTGQLINTIFVPVRLDVKHADISRTWTTGAAIPTLGLAPLIGGLVAMNYDPTVTPLVNQQVDPIISDYIAQQIALTLHYHKSAPRDRFEKLERLKNDGLITEDEYQTQRKKIIDSL